MSAKAAPIGLEQPVKGSFHGVSGVHHSKIDRLAVGTLCGEQPDSGADVHFDSAVSEPSAAGLGGCWTEGKA